MTLKYTRIFMAVGSMLYASVAMADFQIIDTQEEVVSGLRRITMTVQNGTNPLNRFKMHRVVKQNPGEEGLKGAMIFTPALNSTFKIYDMGNNAGGTDFEHSTVAYLAHRNIDVYGYTPRTALIAPGACTTPPEQGGVDCSVMANWGLASILDDLTFIRQQVALVHCDKKPAIGGLSLGAMTAIAAANQDPTAYSGLLLWEGMLYTTDATLTGQYGQMCAALNGALGAGIVFDQTVGPLAKLLLQLSVADPNGPSPLPPFSGFTNRQAYVAFFAGPLPPPPQGFLPGGSSLVAGNPIAGTFTYASENRLATVVNDFTFYERNAVVRDIACSLAGDRTFTGNLSAFTGPILALESGHAFGPFMDENLDLFGSSHIQVREFPNFGHSDLDVHPDHEHLLDKPLTKWLKQKVFH